jgi:predicted 3-demethylubiquinone-9 3-methyltransferase (glyoxalase superfamily)
LPQGFAPHDFAATGESQMTTIQTITPCLWFDRQAEEAARFYTSIFPNSKIDKVLHYSADTPGGKEGGVMLVDFTLAGQNYQALNGGPHHTFNDAISLAVRCADQAEVDRYWNALTADGGNPVQCGWLKDKFGVSWQIVPTALIAMLQDKDRQKAKRVTEALMQMVKLDIGKLQQAYDQAA